MPTVVVTLPNDGETADVADYNVPINSMLAAINGGLDADNLAANAVGTSEITDGAVTEAKLASATKASWYSGVNAPNTVVANGNRSYTLTFNTTDYTGVLSPGMRLRATRSVVAPTQSTNLNGTTQYYSKASPNKLTFTDDFVVSAWVKLSSYASGAIVSRQDATQGWEMDVTATGLVRLVGYNAALGNYSLVSSYQSLPLNKWVHVTAQLDMSAFTATTTTSYIMIDGVDVPASVSRAGTNPTTLVQAGSLFIGAANSTTPSQFFPGKIAQVAIYNAKVTQATILASMHQTLAGTETSLASAYSFNNAITDLNTTTPNDLTANGSAVATNADSPFAQAATAGTLEYGIITAISFSTNTTVTLQVSEGSALPTSGGISAVSYSGVKVPYAFPAQKDKWDVLLIAKADLAATALTSSAWLSLGSGTQLANLNVPIGAWVLGYQAMAHIAATATTLLTAYLTLSTTSAAESDPEYTTFGASVTASSSDSYGYINKTKNVSISAATPYYLNIRSNSASISTLNVTGTQAVTMIKAENAYL